MITGFTIDSLYASNPEFSKHFSLKIIKLKNGDFLYLGLKEDSTGKDLESIMVTLGDFYGKIEDLGVKNIVYSFKEIEYFSDIGLGLTIGFAERTQDKGGTFFILEPKEKVRNVIEIIGLDEFISIFDSEIEFIEEMNK